MPEREKGEQPGVAPETAAENTGQAEDESVSAVSEAVQKLLNTVAETTPAGGPVRVRPQSDTIVVIEFDSDIFRDPERSRV